MKRFEHQWNDFKWIDIENPSTEELLNLAEEFSLQSHAVESCLDPQHLPMADYSGDTLFVVLRHSDPHRTKKSLTMQELTTKLIVFIGDGFILTIHRLPLPCVESKKEKTVKNEPMTQIHFLRNILHRTITSFGPSLAEMDSQNDLIEDRVFTLKRKNILREGYIVKRKSGAYKKIFKFTDDTVTKVLAELEFPHKDAVHVREPLTKYSYFVEEMHDEITGLINLHLSIMSQKTNEASYRTNEIMRTLTVFSMFFLPLNFIAGVYGMNFEYMPELKQPYGYFGTLGLMTFIAVGTFIWVSRKGWLTKDDIK